MGGSWLPDPSIGSSLSDEITIPPVVLLDSDNDDVEAVENNRNVTVSYNEYHLLSDGDNLPDWEGIDQSDSEDNEDGIQFTFESPNENTEVIQLADENESNNEPRDIAVDCDKVKAAMANITLPPSATPSWATSIPDSEWCSYLQNRIRTLQEQTESTAVTK